LALGNTANPPPEIPLAVEKPNKTSWASVPGHPVSPDGTWIAAAVTNGVVKPTIFNGTTGAVAATLSRRLVELGLGGNTAQVFFVRDRPVLLAPSTIAGKGKSGPRTDIVAYDFTKQKIVAVFRGEETSEIVRVAVSGDGRILAAGNREGTVMIWDLAPLR
jgi:WD40 repeat protein